MIGDDYQSKHARVATNL